MIQQRVQHRRTEHTSGGKRQPKHIRYMGATLFLPLMEQFDFKHNSLKFHRASRCHAYLFHFAQMQRILVVRSKLGETHIRTLRQLRYAANAWEKPFGKHTNILKENYINDMPPQFLVFAFT